MRIVSFVPSLTETLIECGVNVVGRTRYCIHPEKEVSSIPVVGGTKDADWEKVRALSPDLVLFDREENTLEMVKGCTLPYHATHITSVETLLSELHALANVVHSEKLHALVKNAAGLTDKRAIGKLPTLKVLNPWDETPKNILYLIWRKPWMAVSRDTFIGSVLDRFGLELPTFDKKYPEIELSDYDPNSTLLLFSSEPYPFQRYEKELQQLGYPSAIVNGEDICWFGIRSIRFLQLNLSVERTDLNHIKRNVKV